jgi:hypothetical protein
LRLGDFLSQLTCLSERNESVLDVGGTLLLDKTDTAKTVGGLGVKDLVEDMLTSFFLLLLSNWMSAR